VRRRNFRCRLLPGDEKAWQEQIVSRSVSVSVRARRASPATIGKVGGEAIQRDRVAGIEAIDESDESMIVLWLPSRDSNCKAR
jgi:hypothetical protein